MRFVCKILTIGHILVNIFIIHYIIVLLIIYLVKRHIVVVVVVIVIEEITWNNYAHNITGAVVLFTQKSLKTLQCIGLLLTVSDLQCPPSRARNY